MQLKRRDKLSMDLKHQIRALEYLDNLFNVNVSSSKPNTKPDKAKQNPLYYHPQKPPLKPSEISACFEESLPEQAGVRSDGLTELFKRISNTDKISPHSMLVISEGKLIAKAEWKPYRMDYPHISHSMCKSIVSMAVGIAINDGLISINDTLGDIFKNYTGVSAEMKKIKISHLLTMTSGVSYNEASALTDTNWIKGFLNSEIHFAPGSKFAYNSLNTYMLSAILCIKTGGSLSSYLSSRLFEPMGITNFYWELCPKGYEKGGWGFYMSIFDYAKLGQLYLQNGKWNGVQLVPEKWVAESVSNKIPKTYNNCYSGYGYQIWQTKNNDGFVFSGMFGQFVFVFPKIKMVIALLAGSENVFPDCITMDIVSGFVSNENNFLGRKILPENMIYTSAANLRKSLGRLNYNEPMYLTGDLSFLQIMRFNLAKSNEKSSMQSTAKMLSGRRIMLEKNKVGLLPLLIQVMNGNFENGIEQVYFSEKNDIFLISFFCSGYVTKVPVGFDREVMYFDFTKNGESYHVGTAGFITSDEDNNDKKQRTSFHRRRM